jgi:hypothetical protein
MTVLHWAVLAVFVLIFIILIVLSMSEKNRKNFLSMAFSSFLLVVVGSVFSLFALDKYTKKGKLLSHTENRSFSTEKVAIRGKIKNNGSFKIGQCKLEVTMSNKISPQNKGKVSYFTPSSSITDMFSSSKNRPNIIKEEFVAVKNLEPGKIKSFNISLPYPTYFDKARYRYRLFCH